MKSMALIELTLDGKTNKVDKAIKAIRAFDPISTGLFDSPYYVCYSGGKDSDALRILFELSGVKYDLVHNLTTADAPETVRYIRSIPGIRISKPETTMWRLIAQRRCPPTLRSRYCCTELKERGGHGRFVSTGVRWDESPKRKRLRGLLEVQARSIRGKLTLGSDNDESRRMFETCAAKGKRVLNPIISWTTEDVWELLAAYGCESNPLYQCGYKRVGCVGCPCAALHRRIFDFERYPKYRDMYLRAFGRMLDAIRASGKETLSWADPESVMKWWLDKDPHKHDPMEGQLELSDLL
jgi:phosphoadenosine phosphosulfate reductase